MELFNCRRRLEKYEQTQTLFIEDAFYTRMKGYFDISSGYFLNKIERIVIGEGGLMGSMHFKMFATLAQSVLDIDSRCT